MKKKYLKSSFHDDFTQKVVSVPQKFQEGVKTVEVAVIVDKLIKAQTAEEQVMLIPSLTEHLIAPLADDFQHIITIFTHLLITSNPKNPVKKSVFRTFVNLCKTTDLADHITIEIARQLLQKIASTEINTENYEKLNIILNAITSCFDNFPAGIGAISLNVPEIFSFLVRCLIFFIEQLKIANSPTALQDILQYIHNTTRGLIATSQQCHISSSVCETYKNKIYVCSSTLINNPDIPYDTKNNCGIIMVTVANITKENGYIDLINVCLEPALSVFAIDLANVATDIGIICIFSGILIVIKPEELAKFNTSTLFLISLKLIEISKHSANDPSIILGVNRALLLVSRCTGPFPLNDVMKLLNLLLEYIWINLDHNVDTIRHIARSVFINLMKLAVVYKDAGNGNLLDMLLKKTLFLSPERSCRYKALTVIANEIGTNIILEKEPNLVSNLIELAKDGSISSYVTSCYENLMRCHRKEVSEEMWVKIWVTPITNHLGQDTDTESGSDMQDLLTASIKLQPSILQTVLPEWCLDNDVQFCSLLKCALIARRIGKDCTMKNDSGVWRGLLQPIVLESAMYHRNDEIRTSSLALICESHKTTEIFNEWELAFVISFLNYNIGTQLPSMRQDILALMKKIMTRFYESYYLIGRILIKQESKAMLGNLKILELLYQQKSYYEKFLTNLRACVFQNLYYGANYSRRMLCLEILQLIELLKKDKKDVWKIEECDAVLSCLADTYESNKAIAVSLLSQCPIGLLQLETIDETKLYVQEAIKLAYSVKPADTITAAYMLETASFSPVLQNILIETMSIPQSKQNYTKEYLMIRYLLTEERCQLEIAKTSLVKAAKSAPLYGVLFCLRHFMEKYLTTNIIYEPYWKPLVAEMIKVCLELNTIVGTVVNSSSPEGHLPMDQDVICEEDDTGIDETATAQMLLVCAWRTVKEVSLLLSEICLQGDIIANGRNGLITEEQVLKIGEHFTVLLTETKHRGAFEQAYIGFAKLCNRMWKCTSKGLHRLPVQWLHDIMQAISGDAKAENTKLCATRRSAGVPFMIQAIVVSELQSGGSVHFHSTMASLIRIGKEGTHVESRTHSMNILRALYRHTQLGEAVMTYVSDGIMVAIMGFTKPAWAERNSATLLFSSLMTRIFGVQRKRDTDELSARNKMTARLFYQKYPALHPFLKSQLSKATDYKVDRRMDSVLYPILLLLARLYPAGLEDESNANLEQFIPFVRKCASNKILKTRELAAKALVPLLMKNKKKTVFKELITQLTLIKENNNFLHGILLQISYILKGITEVEKCIDIVRTIKSTRYILLSQCPIITSLYMQILVQLTTGYKEKPSVMFCKPLLDELDNILSRDILLGRTVYYRSASHLQLHLLSHVAHVPDEVRCVQIVNMLVRNMKHENCIIHQFILNFLIYLLKEEEHSVITDSWDIPEEEKSLVKLFDDELRNSLYTVLDENLEFLISVLESNFTNTDLLSCKSFAILSHFPNALSRIGFYSNNAVNYILQKCEISYDDNMICAMLCCLRTLIKSNALKGRRFSNLLMEFSSPNYSISCRYIIALIIIENDFLLLEKDQVPDGVSLCTLWQVVMQLLGDGETIVRNTISCLSQKILKSSLPVIAERAREILLPVCVDSVKSVSENLCISLLLLWVLQDDEPAEDDFIEGQVFEKGEVNAYMESANLSIAAAKILPDFFSENEISFFKRFADILSKDEHLWINNGYQKQVYSYYFEKIGDEFKKSKDFITIRNNIRGNNDFWNLGDPSLRSKFLIILDSFIGYMA